MLVKPNMNLVLFTHQKACYQNQIEHSNILKGKKEKKGNQHNQQLTQQRKFHWVNQGVSNIGSCCVQHICSSFKQKSYKHFILDSTSTKTQHITKHLSSIPTQEIKQWTSHPKCKSYSLPHSTKHMVNVTKHFLEPKSNRTHYSESSKVQTDRVLAEFDF